MTDFSESPALPHRYPFLFTDRILFTPQEHAEGQLRVLTGITVSGGMFRGGQPAVFPSVLLPEALAQAGGLLIARLKNAEHESLYGVQAGIQRARFRGVACPGDRLLLTVRLLRRRGSLVFLSGEALLDDDCLCRVTFSCAILNSGGDRH